MWPFRKKSKADVAIEKMDEIIRVVSPRWTEFLRTMPFKDEVDLQEKILLFSEPMIQGVRRAYPELKDSPDEYIYLCIVKEIEASGSH